MNFMTFKRAGIAALACLMLLLCAGLFAAAAKPAGTNVARGKKYTAPTPPATYMGGLG